MRIAVIGLGRMGRALAERLLEVGHQVSVWNRTAGRAGALQEQGATVMDSADDLGDDCDAVFLCLADDRSTLDVATPQGEARASWAQTLVVNTGTVAPDVITALAHAYGERFVNAPILGAPQALRSGAAKFIVGGPAVARQALLPLWQAFAGALDVGENPQTAAVIKLLNNQMLLVQLAVIAETIRAGRAAGVDDATLAAILRESPMMPAGLRNRIDVFFDPNHAGWFSTVQGAKDVTLFLDLAKGSGAPLPVTEAARDAYRRVAQDGWETHDVTALVEYGRRSP
ncbi:oxidoreductase [Mycobacterium vulneris]|uniref:Oxidoreductase n=2 Tax=Mycolicibacterium vulneris TaxID=547163 RepID=A0A1X2KSD8_9MYCO|nr:NAD(P)-dependent oxidoreductase [Mycolicibacterium vulneris]OSC24676.1 oxidoreductase [Mycolicibacterium vulneris]